MMLAILIGLSASGITAIARTVAQDHGKAEWLLEKPLSCDLCMSFWGSFLSVAVWSAHQPLGFAEAAVTMFGGVGSALVLTKAANRLGG